MKTTKEVLRLVAEAARIEILGWNDGTEPYSSGEGYILTNNRIWNPIVNDGDAFRLAIALEMQVEYLEFSGNARARTRHMIEGEWFTEYCIGLTMHKDPAAAARRAIVAVAIDLYERLYETK